MLHQQLIEQCSTHLQAILRWRNVPNAKVSPMEAIAMPIAHSGLRWKKANGFIAGRAADEKTTFS